MLSRFVQAIARALQRPPADDTAKPPPELREVRELLRQVRELA